MRENSQGLDLNREGAKLTSVESQGLIRTLNAWDPLLFLDGHLMSRVNHGYANTYGTATIPAAAPGPRDYMTDTLFPAVRDAVRAGFGLEVFTHALATPDTWPPTAWSHDRAAWTVEARGTDQLLLCDFQGRTRSWLMVTPGEHGHSTRLYFGSAVVARVDRRTGRSRMGWGFHALLGFHRLYSRALLRAAQRRLQREAAAGAAR